VAGLRVLALDESAFRRRLRLRTVLFDPVGRQALEVVDGRDHVAAPRLLWRLPAAIRDEVQEHRSYQTVPMTTLTRISPDLLTGLPRDPVTR
jgi:hypothetical protein